MFHSSRWQCQQARIVPEGYAMEWCLLDLTGAPHDTYMCRNSLPTPSSKTVEMQPYLWDSVCLHILQACGQCKGAAFPFLIIGNSDLSFMVSRSGDWRFEPFQEARSEEAPRHWHDHGNRWNYSFPMVWPPFPGPLWGTCVSASGIWVIWSLIFIQIVARKTSIHLETKRPSSWFN